MYPYVLASSTRFGAAPAARPHHPGIIGRVRARSRPRRRAPVSGPRRHRGGFDAGAVMRRPFSSTACCRNRCSTFSHLPCVCCVENHNRRERSTQRENTPPRFKRSLRLNVWLWLGWRWVGSALTREERAGVHRGTTRLALAGPDQRPPTDQTTTPGYRLPTNDQTTKASRCVRRGARRSCSCRSPPATASSAAASTHHLAVRTELYIATTRGGRHLSVAALRRGAPEYGAQDATSWGARARRRCRREVSSLLDRQTLDFITSTSRGCG